MPFDLKSVVVKQTERLIDCVRQLDESGRKTLFVLDDDNKLLGSLSDGDIRRALLRNCGFDAPALSFCKKNPITAPDGTSRNRAKSLMMQHHVLSIPIVDLHSKLLDVVFWDEESFAERDNTVVIMAGGQGLRLQPLTNTCPKPLLNIAGKPMIERVILNGVSQGFLNYVVSVNYLADQIMEYLGDGRQLGCSIQYLRETEPLGTAGSLSLLNELTGITAPFIVTNADILTSVDYRQLLQFHIDSKAATTMAVRSFKVQNPFGVVEVVGSEITNIVEKPSYDSLVNAGIYCLDEKVLNQIHEGEKIDMPDLMMRMLNNGHSMQAFFVHEDWRDLGSHHDLKAAEHAFKTN